ncbi:flagellar basal body P-ring formation chaperone FlgA [Nitrospinota bacterium]
MRNLAVCVFFALSVAIPAATPAISEGVEVRLMPSAEVEEGEILLVEVAQILGASRRIRTRLEDISIAPETWNGNSFRVSREDVARSIQEAGISGVTLTGARQIHVRNTARNLMPDEMAAAVRSYLKTRLMNHRGDVEIKAVTVPRHKVLLPRGGKIHLAVKAPANSRFIGRTPLILRVMRGASEIRRIWVTAEIGVYAEVLVARRPIRPKQRLRAEYFEMRRMDMASLPADTIMTAEDIEGARAIQSLGPGDVVRKSDVRFPFLVKRGHLVRVIARRGSLAITAVGKALDAGRKGDLVRVVNIDSNKPVHARVVEDSFVEVLF